MEFGLSFGPPFSFNKIQKKKWTKFFLDHIFLFSDQILFGPIFSFFIRTKNFLRTKIFFRPKFFFDQNFFGTNFFVFSMKFFFDRYFFLFRVNIFFPDQHVFQTKIFMGPNLFRPNFLLTKSFFWTNIFFRPTFFGPTFFFLDQNLLCPKKFVVGCQKL